MSRHMLVSFALLLPAVAEGMDLRGAGAAFAAPVYEHAVFTYRFANATVSASYHQLGSARALCRLAPGPDCPDDDTDDPTSVAFAATERILPEQYYERYPDLQMYPFAAQAVAPVFNLPGLAEAGLELVLNPDTLSGIFSGRVTRWNDTEILGANPMLAAAGLLPGQPITVAVRDGISGTTEIFRTALSGFGPKFVRGFLRDDFGWGNATAVPCQTSFILGAYVAETPYSMGYLVLPEAKRFGLPCAGLLKYLRPFVDGLPGSPGVLVRADTESLFAAVTELGGSFGNTGEDPSRLTVNLNNARGLLAWPIVGYSYVVVRKLSGGSCEAHRALTKFLSWSLDEEFSVRRTIRRMGYMWLTPNVRGVVVPRIREDMLCNGEAVHPPTPTPTLHVKGTKSFSSVMDTLGFSYGAVEEGVSVSYDLEDPSVAMALVRNGVFTADDFPTSVAIVPYDLANDSTTLVTLPFSGQAFAVVYSFCPFGTSDGCVDEGQTLTLDVPLVAALLSGAFEGWSDPRLLALNPWMAQEPAASFLASRPPSVFLDDEDADAVRSLKMLLRQAQADLGFEYHEDELRHCAHGYEQVLTAVTIHAPAIGVVPLSAPLPETLSVAAIKRPSGRAVRPSSESVLQCAYDTILPSGAFELSRSANDECYPLSTAFVLQFRNDFSDAECDGETPMPLILARWLQWMYCGTDGTPRAPDCCWSSPMSPKLAQHALGPLATAHKEHVAHMLLSLQCNGSSMLLLEVEDNQIPRSLVYFTWAINFILYAFALALLVWTIHDRERPALAASQPAFLLLIILGFVISYAAVFPSSLDYTWFDPDPDAEPGKPGYYPQLDIACNAQVWLYCIGFVLTYGSLFAKLWRVKKIMINPKLATVKISVTEMLVRILLLMLVELVVLSVWAAVDPAFYKFVETRDARGLVVEMNGYCATETMSGAAFIISLVSVHLVLLMYGFVLVLQARNVPTQYNEGKFISIAIGNTLQTTAIVILLSFFIYNDPQVFYIVKWTGVFMSEGGTLLLVFIPKLIQLCAPFVIGPAQSGTSRPAHSSDKGRTDGTEKVGGGSGTAASVCIASSHVEVDMVEELRAENEDLREQLHRMRERVFNNGVAPPVHVSASRLNMETNGKYKYYARRTSSQGERSTDHDQGAARISEIET